MASADEAAAKGTPPPPASLPHILTYCYTNIKQHGRDRTAKCKCWTIKEKGSTTSNFLRHIEKVQKERYAEYKAAQKTSCGEAQEGQSQTQSSLDSFVGLKQGVKIYSLGHPRQKAITNSIIHDLIISCNLPLSLVDMPSFKNFTSEVDEKYCPVSRSTVTRRLSDLAFDEESKIKSKLQNADTVSVTVDIWTDWSMRGFLGVTAHFMEEMEKNSVSRLQTVLLSCDRFTGSHTGIRISEQFEEICDKFNLKHKLDYIISDNASNRKKAFTVCFPSTTRAERCESDDKGPDDHDLENSDFWEDPSETLQEDVDTIQSSCRQGRLQCFAHSLQLVVRDGLKEIKIIYCALGKVTKLCSLLHMTCGLKEAFERTYGANRSIPSAVATRWNSTCRLVQAVTDLDPQSLITLLEDEGHKSLCLTGQELSQLKELVEILGPFL